MAAQQAAAPNTVFGKGSFIQKYSDVMIAVAIVTIVVMMIIPLPTLLLRIAAGVITAVLFSLLLPPLLGTLRRLFFSDTKTETGD